MNSIILKFISRLPFFLSYINYYDVLHTRMWRGGVDYTIHSTFDKYNYNSSISSDVIMICGEFHRRTIERLDYDPDIFVWSID